MQFENWHKIRDENKTLRLDPTVWSKMFYWKEEALIDFLGDEYLLGDEVLWESKGVTFEMTKPLLWNAIIFISPNLPNIGRCDY